MAVVAVTVPEVEVLPAEPVDELRLAARCSALEVENEGLWGETSRLLGENERPRSGSASWRAQLEEARRAGSVRQRRSRAGSVRRPRVGRVVGLVMSMGGMVTVSR